MSQMSFSDFEYADKRKQTWRERFWPRWIRSCPGRGWRHLSSRAIQMRGGRKPVSTGNHAAHSPVAELVFAEQPGHGGSTVRNHADAPVRSFNAERADSRRHHDHEVPPLAGEAPAGCQDSPSYQWLAPGQGLVVALGHHCRCHNYPCTELDEEQGRQARP